MVVVQRPCRWYCHTSAHSGTHLARVGDLQDVNRRYRLVLLYLGLLSRFTVSLFLEDGAHTVVIGDTGLAQWLGLVDSARDERQGPVFKLHAGDSLASRSVERTPCCPVLKKLIVCLSNQRFVIACLSIIKWRFLIRLHLIILSGLIMQTGKRISWLRKHSIIIDFMTFCKVIHWVHWSTYHHFSSIYNIFLRSLICLVHHEINSRKKWRSIAMWVSLGPASSSHTHFLLPIWEHLVLELLLLVQSCGGF